MAQYQDTIIISYPEHDGDSSYRITDTLIRRHTFSPAILVGDTFLSGSTGWIQMRGIGLDLASFEATACNPNERPEGEDSFISLILNDSLLEAELKIYSNCCHSFLGDVTLVNDSTLSFDFHTYGNFCACDCCFGLKYRFVANTFNQDFKKLEYFLINGVKPKE